MQFNILGSLEVREGECVHTPRAPKPRKLLALLLAHANRPVSTWSLMEEVWESELPPSAPSTLQTYICQLRRMLAVTSLCRDEASTPHDVLVSAPGSYKLAVAADAVDAWRFTRLAGKGSEAFRSGWIEQAAALLAEALCMWRGPALVDVQAGSLLAPYLRQLEEKRLCTLEMRIEADMLLGRHRNVVDELKALTSEHPLHEGLHSQLMFSLCHSGRRADALNTYQSFRSVLVDELGIEPGAQLQQTQRVVLRDLEDRNELPFAPSTLSTTTR